MKKMNWKLTTAFAIIKERLIYMYNVQEKIKCNNSVSIYSYQRIHLFVHVKTSESPLFKNFLLHVLSLYKCTLYWGF